MPRTDLMPVKDLRLDLFNLRTIPQPDEIHAVQALILLKPDYFWGLVESIIDSGYLPTENIIVLESDDDPLSLTVKEGNRRVAALKLILGYIPQSAVEMPSSVQSTINGLTNEWKTSNETVPCTIYPPSESGTVDRIVDLAHGKGEKAGRVQWTAVSRARHNRDRKQSGEPGLDLLEKYLKNGRNLTARLAEKWAGDYPITVLDEAMPKIAARLGLPKTSDLVDRYPGIPHRHTLESILLDIGMGRLGFPEIRDTANDFGAPYGLPLLPTSGKGANTPSSSNPTGAVSGTSSGAGVSTSGSSGGTGQNAGRLSATSGVGAGITTTGSGTGSTRGRRLAVAMNNPQAVRRMLKSLKPVGNRSKVVTLRDEMLRLKLEHNPLAFCFLLRSMFEISAKAYCDDHAASGGPKATEKNGQDRKLAGLLRDITNHLTNNMQDQAMLRRLHGALTELNKPTSVLSVTSMNQLVHNPAFSVTPSDICTMFGNVFPLLEAMNW